MNKKQYIAPALEVIEMASLSVFCESDPSTSLNDEKASGGQLSGKKSSSSIWGEDESSSSPVWDE